MVPFRGGAGTALCLASAPCKHSMRLTTAPSSRPALRALQAPPDPQPLGAGTIAALLSKQETNPETAAVLLSSTGAPPGTAPAQAASLMAGLGAPQAPAGMGMPAVPGMPQVGRAAAPPLHHPSAVL